MKQYRVELRSELTGYTYLESVHWIRWRAMLAAFVLRLRSGPMWSVRIHTDLERVKSETFTGLKPAPPKTPPGMPNLRERRVIGVTTLEDGGKRCAGCRHERWVHEDNGTDCRVIGCFCEGFAPEVAR